ncbi:PDZ domain-containing protein [Thiorhodococcus minor]|uniref:PDZ domain-containing protein n=1 Tax=Thiorhodococcus minor TaxID=57489 RepID=A0A6M0K3U6_9GAMM|nr:PDZ domain-containing protein [Thiorhodococcus minor]NEV64089.1 PDZ domain-containing protein [Thiorhodococcus minor]
MLKRCGAVVVLSWLCSGCSGTAVITESRADRVVIEASNATDASVSAEANRGCAFYGRSALPASSTCLDAACARQDHEFTCSRVDTHRIASPWLGISVDDIRDHQYAEPPGSPEVVVTRIFVDRPAFQAGLRVGDIVEAFNGTRITAAAMLIPLKKKVRPGNRVELSIRRGGERLARVIRPR